MIKRFIGMWIITPIGTLLVFLLRLVYELIASFKEAFVASAKFFIETQEVFESNKKEKDND